MAKGPFICHNCGQEWETHPFLVVACPQCHAPKGAWCRRPSEHSGPFTDLHVAREQAAVDAGLLPLCPAGPTLNPQPEPQATLPFE